MVKEVNQALAREFGLSAEEYQRVLDIMGRTPSLTELGIFSVMWSEHCSYKSSRIWLKQLPTTAPWVIHGPGGKRRSDRYWRGDRGGLQDGES